MALKKKYTEEYREGKAYVTCEVAPHHLYFTSRHMRAHGDLLKMNPPLRPEADKEELLCGLRNGAIEMLATDHAPHTLEEKRSENPPSGVPGLDDYGRFVTWLIKERNFPLKRIAEVTSFNPAQYLGLNDRGRIAEGYIADLTILAFDSDERHSLYTKCGWSPYESESFSGRVAYTIRRGKIVAENGSVLV